MVHRQGAGLLLSVFTTASGSNFVPFAGVEELKPQPLHNFCSDHVLERREGHGALRRCQHHFRKRLEDESDLELGWSMDVDPDSILSLDTEAERGVRLHSCSPSELELELPEEHSHHAAEGKVIVGSRFSHSCEHRPDMHLVHRVTKVHSQDWRGGPNGNRVFVRLQTEELANLAHAVPSYKFYFHWMPAEARDIHSDYPEMRTDYGDNREFLAARRLHGEAEARRLFSMPFSPAKMLSKNLKQDKGGFASGGKTSGAFNTQDGMLNLKPKQLSNFGWNWDFFMNTTAQPKFELNVPGARGRMKIKHPYVKVHSGIYLNFSSEFSGLTTPPLVRWRAGIKGHGRVEGRMIGSMNTTGDSGADPFMAFKLPIFQQLETPRWFEKVDFATGSLPISMSPGVQMSAQMYHRGTFHGGLGFGGRTQGTMNPSLSYDSLKGFDIHFQANLTNTTVWPPFWMIFTKHFEMGIMLKPSLLMRGDFAGLEKATMAIQMRPYMNITINREGSEPTAASGMKKLTVYPIRIMGLPDASLQKKYKVRVTVMGKSFETSPQVNWGQVSFRDHISNFDCGDITQKALINPSQTPVVVTVLEVDETTGTPVDTQIGQGQARCGSLLNGECQPSPETISILDASSQQVAALQLAIIWQENPETWFASHIRGLSFSFPQVILRQNTLTASFPNAVTPGSQNPQLSMHLMHGGQSYVVPLIGTIGQEQSALTGGSTIEFAPCFTDTWLPCGQGIAKCESPRLALYAGEVQIGAADVPLLDFTSQTAMQGTSGRGGFLSGSGGGEMNVPSTIAITAPGNSASTVALATMNSRVVLMLSSSMIFQPYGPTHVSVGTAQQLMWTITDVDTTKEYDFTLAAYRLTTVAPTSMQAYVNFRQVNGQVLMPIKDSIQKVNSLACQKRSSKQIPAARTPCSFLANFQVGAGQGLDVGNEIVVLIAWENGGTNHEMYTQALQVVATGRRLGGNATCDDFSCEVPARRLEAEWSPAGWNDRLKQGHIAKACAKKDLEFKVGAGMLMRGKIESISVPAGFPMIGGLSEQPELATDFKRIVGVSPGADLNEASGENSLPCQLGLCKGLLPGCTQVPTDKRMDYRPKMLINLTRHYHYGANQGRFHGLMKEALAYAFSTLPEMVDVVVKEVKEGKIKWPSMHSPSAPAPAPPANWWKTTARPSQPSMDWPSRTVTQAPTSFPQRPDVVPPPNPAKDDHAVNDAFSKWWSGAADSRRLSSAVGSRDEFPAELEGHQVMIDFKNGVPFVIDRPLVQMMIDHGYFKGLEDVEDEHFHTHGPLAITGFYVDSGIPLDVDGASAAPEESEPARVPSVLSLTLACSAGMSVIFLAAFVRGSWRKARARSEYLACEAME